MPLENIGRREAVKRLLSGLIALIFAVTGYILLLGGNRFWRLFLFVPLYLAALGYFQFKGRT
jgi:hypothetical protein